MTPSNPDNNQPLIYRIADNLGVFHLVAPVDHTHLTTEVSGLTEALATKANAAAVETALAGKMDKKTIDSAPTANSNNLVTSGGVKAALNGKRDLVGQTISLIINGQEIEIESSDVPNLIRALSNPDSTPTANSDKLVTSGGVKAAIDAATNVIETNDVGYDASILEKGIVYTFLFHNETGEIVALEELIDSDALPNPESFTFFNADGMHTEIGNGDTAALRVIRTSRGIFVHYDGIFDY